LLVRLCPCGCCRRLASREVTQRALQRIEFGDHDKSRLGAASYDMLYIVAGELLVIEGFKEGGSVDNARSVNTGLRPRRNNKSDHLAAHGNRSGSTSLTVAGPPDEEFQGRANSCRSGSGPFGACVLPVVFELWWPSAFTSVSTFTKVSHTAELHNEFTRTPNACEADVGSQSADTPLN
jgi:hypothetical protein